MQINHNCCYECGDSLDDIFCQRCTCKSCGKGAHYGYNCPPQILIISNLEPCYNQNLNEILQNLQSLQQQCLLGTCQQCGCNEYDGVCFYCTVGNGTPINFSTSYSSNDSPSFENHPPQPQYETNICELCGNDAHFGYDCSPQVPFIYNQDPCSNQNFDYFPQTSPSFPQQCLCCENCRGPHATFQCQPMNQDFYNSNLSGFDQIQTPQFLVNYPPQETSKEILQAQDDLMEAIQAFLKEYDHIPPNEKCMGSYEITPGLLIEDPDNSLSINEHLNTIPSVENRVPILSELEGISDDTCDVPVCEDPSTFDALNDHSEILSDSNNDGTSSDDDSYENIEYVEASPLNLEIISLEEVNTDQEEKEEVDIDVEDDDSFTFVTRTFLSYLTYPKAKRSRNSRRTKNDRVKYEWDAKQGLFGNLKSSCTDIAKILRKWSKPDKTGQTRTRERKECTIARMIKDSGKKDDSSNKPAGGSRKKTLARKRAGEKQSEESAKRKKLEDAVEKEELKTYLKIDPDEDRAINYEALATKYPIIDWESQIIGSDLQKNDLSYWKITRADGSSNFYKVFSMMLEDF
ncbi:hypothetical protein Tco_0437952 [Tanacetum coccineum]